MAAKISVTCILKPTLCPITSEYMTIQGCAIGTLVVKYVSSLQEAMFQVMHAWLLNFLSNLCLI